MSTHPLTQPQGLSTTCVHAGVAPDATHGAIMTPIFQTSTFVQDYPGRPKTYDYARGGNPTRAALESSLAALENAQHAISFASGLAAVQAVAHLLTVGDHVLVCSRSRLSRSPPTIMPTMFGPNHAWNHVSSFKNHGEKIISKLL